MKKNNPDNCNIHGQNSGHISESRQQSQEWASFSKLKSRFLHISKSRAGVIDVTEYTKITVQTEYGVYKSGDCQKRYAERQKANQSSTTKLYGAEFRLEGHVGDIKGRFDDNEDTPQLRISDQEE